MHFSHITELVETAVATLKDYSCITVVVPNRDYVRF